MPYLIKKSTDQNLRKQITDALNELESSFSGGSVSDDAYGAGWNGDTTTAPSKNAVYDKIESLSGGVSDGDKGDITVSGSGATWTIDNEAVTLGKMANMATGSFIGRDTAGTGAPEVLSAATAKTLLNLAGTNTGDQTTIVGITGTKAQFDTSVTDGNFLYVGDVTQYTDEMAQDAVGAMVDTTLTYADGTPLLQRAALTGHITAAAGSNDTLLGSFTKAQLNTAVSDGNVLYVGDAIPKRTLGITFDGDGSPPTAGSVGYVVSQFAGTIDRWDIVADTSGSAVVDVWKAAGSIPVNANSIAGSEKPTLTAAQLANDSALSSWTTAVAVGDVFGFELESVATCTRVTAQVRIAETL